MTTLNQYARPEWAAPRKETWYEHLLPQRVTDTINQSPLVGALSKYMNSPPPDLTLPSERDSKVPMPRSPSWFDDRPVATEALDKFGLLANFIGPGAKLPPPAPKPQGIRAYHGSPHDFDRFDMSKIGTGEGRQQFGRGLYFAENEKAARWYKSTLSDRTIEGRPINYSDPRHLAADYLDSFGPQNAALEMAKDIDRVGVRQALEHLARGDVPKIDGGHLYEVKINARPEQFLDWDALPQQRRSELLTEQGVKGAIADGYAGTQHLDRGSRGAATGTRNYAVFDDKLVEILRKYGLLPPVAAGAAMAQGQEPPL